MTEFFISLAIVLITVGIALASVWMPALIAKVKSRRKDTSPMQSKVDLLCSILKDDWESWDVGRHIMYHRPLKFSIWHANEDYGLGVNLDGYDVGPNEGGLTGPQKDQVWAAIGNKMEAIKMDKDLESVEKLARKILDHYGQKEAAE